MDKISVLKDCTIDGNIIKLPNYQVDRKIYLDIKKSMELIGGKWKGGKIFGFLFNSDPTSLLDKIIGGGNIKKEFQFFETPEHIVERMFDKIDIKEGDRCLEPSAGQGAIIKKFNELNIIPECFELMDINIEILKKSDLKFKLIGKDFLESNGRKYDVIIANPPFSKNQDIIHLKKMYSKLNKGGRLVSIILEPNEKKSIDIYQYFQNVDGDINFEHLYREFKSSGTNVNTVMVTILKN